LNLDEKLNSVALESVTIEVNEDSNDEGSGERAETAGDVGPEAEEEKEETENGVEKKPTGVAKKPKIKKVLTEQEAKVEEIRRRKEIQKKVKGMRLCFRV
jgi:hypothetical protein